MLQFTASYPVSCLGELVAGNGHDYVGSSLMNSTLSGTCPVHANDIINVLHNKVYLYYLYKEKTSNSVSHVNLISANGVEKVILYRQRCVVMELYLLTILLVLNLANLVLGTETTSISTTNSTLGPQSDNSGNVAKFHINFLIIIATFSTLYSTFNICRDHASKYQL